MSLRQSHSANLRQSHSSSVGSGGARGDLLGAIRARPKLNHVVEEEGEEEKTGGSGGFMGGLLREIEARPKLNHVGEVEKLKGGERKGLVGALSVALDKRRGALRLTLDNDDEWEEGYWD